MSEYADITEDEFLDKEYAHAYMDSLLNAEIATQIKTLREQQHLTQEELADLADMKQERISLLENVDYESWSLKTLKKLAYAFDLSLKVSFEEFSQRLNDAESFSQTFFERISREEDLRKTKAISNKRIEYSDMSQRPTLNLAYILSCGVVTHADQTSFSATPTIENIDLARCTQIAKTSSRTI